MMGFIDTSLQLHSILTAHNQLLSLLAPFPAGPRASSLPLNEEFLLTP
jgi:hypothetical protein